MLNTQRWYSYRSQLRLPDGRPHGATSAQIRRMKHKQYSRKTHQHTPGSTCERCKPGWEPARERRPEQQA